MDCRNVQPLLSEYIDNALSGRSTWEVDRHLADCHECTRLLNELRRTADLVGSAPRFEVSPDFMSNLQSRLARLEPEPARSAWLEGIRRLFRPRVIPAWGAALGTCVLAVILMIPRPGAKLTPASEPMNVQVAARQNVALSASDPFADTAAANLTAHVATQPEGAGDSVN